MKSSVFTTMLLPKLGALLLTALCCQFALGATVNQEKERLAKLQQDLANNEQKVLSIQAEMQSFPAKIAKAQEAVTKAEADLEIEQGKFDKAKKEHASAPTESTERQLRLGEIKAGLAATKVRSETRDLEKLQGEQQELKNSLASIETAIKSKRSQIQNQQNRVADTIELARQQEMEATKPITAPPKPEPKIAVVKPIIEPPRPVEVAIPEPAVDAPVPSSSDSPVPTSNTIALSESEFAQFQFAKEQMATIEKLAAEATNGEKANYDDLLLSGSDINDVPFTYLGNQQYRTEIKLPSGRQFFRIRGLRFQLDIPESDSTQEYVFLVDAREKNNLSASYFKKIFLSYFDNDVRLAPKSDAVASVDKKQEYDASRVAKQRLADAEAIAAEATSNDQPNHSDLQLSGSEIDDTTFTYMGNQQYRVDVTLPSGRQTFRVKGLRFQLDIPESTKAEEYVFIVDARDKNDFEASYFKKDLLSYDDKDIAATQ